MAPVDSTKTVVLAVNVGTRKNLQIGNRLVETGIFKEPATGPVEITANGLANDVIADKSRHGGPDQAVYLYSFEDLTWWNYHLQRELSPGFFGENLTISKWWPDMRVGDRLQRGSLILEITFPRIPCASLAARVGDAGFLKTFITAGKPGAYARVIAPGSVTAGDSFTLQRAPDTYPLIDTLFELWHANNRDRELIKQALHFPIADRARAAFEHWLSMDGIVREQTT
jgi:MOSC domain-containing protein YiiM